MLQEVKVSLASLLGAMLWVAGGVLVIGGAFGCQAAQNVGLGLLVVAAVLSLRSAMRCGLERERRAFDLGRECGEGGNDDGTLRAIRS